MIKTRDEIKKIVNDLGYELLDEYIGYDNNRRVIIQDGIGYKYDVVLFKLMGKNKGVSFVAKGNPFVLLNISIWLKKNNKKFELCNDNVYTGNNNNLNFYCHICKERFYMSWRMIYSNRGCAICSGQQVCEKTSLAYLKPDLTKEYLYSKNNKTPYDVVLGSNESAYWRCKNCGHEWWAIIKNRTKVDGSDCPRCADEQKESIVATHSM